MDDLISRQAAITQLSHNKNKGDDEWELAVENDIQTVWQLPPIQPEIVRCKDCQHYEYGICKKAGLYVNKSPNGFCDWAERREDTE